MGWVYREADLHKCKKPLWDKTIKRGDRWKCDECNLIYRVTDVKTWYDQRDNYEGGSLTWELYRVANSGGYLDR